MIEVVRFVVMGTPQPAGSKRAFAIRKGGVPTGKVAVADDNPRAKSWQGEIREQAARAMMFARGMEDDRGFDPAPDLLDGALSLDLRFYLRRPRAHYGTGRNAGKLKPDAPRSPTVRPDVLKLTRAVEDALTGVVWRDDAQVVSEVLAKFYGEPERVIVGVWPLSNVMVEP